MTQQREERVTKLVVIVYSKTHSTAELSAMLGLVPDESWKSERLLGAARGSAITARGLWWNERSETRTAALRQIGWSHDFRLSFPGSKPYQRGSRSR
jgi:hypothetical protein